MSVIIKKPKLKSEIYHIIRNDIPLRDKIASQLGITVNSVYQYARRKSRTLQKPFVLDIIKDHLKIDDSELLET